MSEPATVHDFQLFLEQGDDFAEHFLSNDEENEIIACDEMALESFSKFFVNNLANSVSNFFYFLLFFVIFY